MQFDTPLRVTWTAAPGSPVAVVAEALAAARVMEVSVEAPLAVLAVHLASLAALSRVSQVELVLDARELPAGDGVTEAVAPLLANGLTNLTVDFTSALETAPAGDDGLSLLALLRQVHPALSLAVAAAPDADNLDLVLRLTEAAARAGEKVVKLRHPDVVAAMRRPGQAALRPLTPAALCRARAVFPAERPDPGCNLLVHDLFLKEALLGTGRGAYGGCQAGNAMAHVDQQGLVYPCSALPVIVGDLSDQRLELIWRSDPLEDIRQHLAAPPRGCSSCGRLDACHGGCRGLSHYLSGSWDDPDPACPNFTARPDPTRPRGLVPR